MECSESRADTLLCVTSVSAGVRSARASVRLTLCAPWSPCAEATNVSESEKLSWLVLVSEYRVKDFDPSVEWIATELFEMTG